MLPDQRQTIREGRFILLVPRRPVERHIPVWVPPHTQHHDQRKQAEQHGCRPCYRLVRLLPLRLHAELSAGFFKRHLDRPPLHHQAENLFRRCRQVGAAERFVAQFALRVSDQDVTNLNGTLTRRIPQRYPRRLPGSDAMG